MRKDGLKNRALVIEAARARFRAGAAEVSLEDIAADARVGRSTLFRHFANKLDLIQAVQAVEEQTLAEASQMLGERPDAIFEMMRMVARLSVLYRAMDDALVRTEEGRLMMERAVRQTGALFSSHVDRAKSAGLLNDDVTLDDILMASSMMGGVLVMRPESLEDAIDKALSLLLDGLKTRRSA